MQGGHGVPAVGSPEAGSFSTGSITFCGSLLYNDADNDISRIVSNVLRRFLADEPSTGPGETCSARTDGAIRSAWWARSAWWTWATCPARAVWAVWATPKTMKIAVFADVHSNLDALETVLEHIDRWCPDRVLCAGDIINRGPNPRTCTERVLTRADAEDWGVIYGNHERYVLKYGKGNLPERGPEYEIIRHAKWTYDQLADQVGQGGPNHSDHPDSLVERLEALSFQWAMTDESGNEFRMVHASMLGDRKGIFPDDTEASLREKIAPAPGVLVVGHTHRPLIRYVDDTLVVNAGAVGAPSTATPGRPTHR